MGIVVRHIRSTALPDYVFDEGERQPRSGQKRPKTKGSGKSSNTSPDVPNKKRRSSHTPSGTTNGTVGVTSNNNSIIPVIPHQQNGNSTLSDATIPGLDPPPQLTAIPKDVPQIKTPHLPFGENVAIATSPAAAAASVSSS